TGNFEHLIKIREAGLPLVFFDRICEEIDSDRVVVDDEAGAYEAVKHLIETGRRKIVHLSGPQNLMISQGRKAGYIRALSEYNLPVKEENIIRCDTAEEARLIVPGLLSRKERPDGIFAVNDLTAAETMKIIKQHGFKVPEDISLVGFTSGMISDITDPTLSSVEQHGYEMGREAVRLLIVRLESKEDQAFQTKIIKTELVIKGSSFRR
ncbi:MAG: LacI family transcriptional regulator, partial [Odoribacter sp.]|nr:LacI family transcriptional regulator [Odoribacter sp.]